MTPAKWQAATQAMARRFARKKKPYDVFDPMKVFFTDNAQKERVANLPKKRIRRKK